MGAALRRCCCVSAQFWYSSKYLYWRIYKKSWRKSILNNEEPLKKEWRSELRMDTKNAGQQIKKRTEGMFKRRNQQSIPGYTALPESIWGSRGCRPTELCKELWYHWGPELDWNLPIKFPPHGYRWKEMEGVLCFSGRICKQKAAAISSSRISGHPEKMEKGWSLGQGT